jgi:hypothetical protein
VLRSAAQRSTTLPAAGRIVARPAIRRDLRAPSVSRRCSTRYPSRRNNSLRSSALPAGARGRGHAYMGGKSVRG